MDPVAFEILGIPIKWYGILISIGFLVGAYLAIREAKKVGIDEEKLIDLLIFALPAAIIGARLYYVVFSWDYYRGNPLKIINIRGGGLAIHGGIIAAILVAIVFCKKKSINFWQIADITAPSIILGQAIGRWGNYINQEAYGTLTDLPWGIIINGQKVHPTFLYESIWDFSVFLFLLWYRKNKAQVKGEVFLLYVILYSIGRFLIEGLRIDSLMLGPIRVAQLISLVLISVGIAIFVIRRKLENGK